MMTSDDTIPAGDPDFDQRPAEVEDEPKAVRQASDDGADPDTDSDRVKPDILASLKELETAKKSANAKYVGEARKLLAGVDRELEKLNARQTELFEARARIVSAIHGPEEDEHAGLPDFVRQQFRKQDQNGVIPGPKERKPALARTRGARANKAAVEDQNHFPQSFKAQLLDWLKKHPNSVLGEMKAAFPKEKAQKISSTLMLAKRGNLVKSHGTRRSMRWSVN